MPTDGSAGIPAGHPCALDVCRWPVTVSRGHGWKCTAPFGHEDAHALILGGRVMARAAGFSMEGVRHPGRRASFTERGPEEEPPCASGCGSASGCSSSSRVGSSAS